MSRTRMVVGLVVALVCLCGCGSIQLVGEHADIQGVRLDQPVFDTLQVVGLGLLVSVPKERAVAHGYGTAYGSWSDTWGGSGTATAQSHGFASATTYETVESKELLLYVKNRLEDVGIAGKVVLEPNAEVTHVVWGVVASEDADTVLDYASAFVTCLTLTTWLGVPGTGHVKGFAELRLYEAEGGFVKAYTASVTERELWCIYTIFSLYPRIHMKAKRDALDAAIYELAEDMKNQPTISGP